ncbi:MAG: glycosyltransferase [Anaerolineae bacterium]|nr:glycosyltransferase [Anaerolineae bacterium]
MNEILAHEAAGLSVEIFSLRYPIDGRFHDTLAMVRAPLTYLTAENISASALWTLISDVRRDQPKLWSILDGANDMGVRDVYQAMLLAQAAQRRDITNLHAHFGSVATRVARLASKIAGLPYTFTAHAKDIYHQDVDKEAMRCSMEDAATVITVSDYNRRHLIANYGQAASHVERVYNGLNLERFSYQTPLGRPPRILSVGRLVEKKGFSYLIEACAELARRGRDFRCSIIGTGPLEDALHEQIIQLGLETHVELLGPEPQVEVIRQLTGSAVFAAPFVISQDGNREGLPTVLLEAMASGTPCISTDVTGVPEVIRHEVTGLLVRPQDAIALANALERILHDEALGLKMAKNARRLIEENFDNGQTARAMREIFVRAAQASPVSQLAVEPS